MDLWEQYLRPGSREELYVRLMKIENRHIYLKD